jgi:uncharacterized LabA/DUF88 family protein
MPTSDHTRSALFVDFDNIYITLKKQEGLAAANKFATNPQLWLSWLEHEMSLAHMGDNYTSRRILIRKCYMNPAVFSNFRPYFTLAAFDVIDCPALTEMGKTSTDIHVVMDIMDTLNHPYHYDEFILLSADADFTPVLLRVRQFDRRSVVLAAGFPSPAYKSACDFLPPVGVFLREALGIHTEEEEEPKVPIGPVNTPKHILERLADSLVQRAAHNGIVYSYDLPAVYKHVDEFTKSTTWLEFRSLRRLTDAVVKLRPLLRIEEDLEEGNWGVRLHSETPEHPVPVTKKLVQNANLAESSGEEENNGDLRSKVAAFVIAEVQHSPEPVVMSQLASQVMQRFGRQVNNESWLGAASFKIMLEQLDLDGLRIHNQIPGYVYDPSIHHLEQLAPNGDSFDTKARLTAEFKEKYPLLQPLAFKIYQLTELPYLLPEHYAQVLNQLARALNENGYDLTSITRLVRDRCVERGVPVSRKQVNFITVGISYTGYKMGQPDQQETAAKLAEQLYLNANNLCESARLNLDAEEKNLLRQWLVEGEILPA